MSRTNYVPLKIVCGADVSAGTPFLSFTEYLHSAQRNSLILNTVELEARVGIERFMFCFPSKFAQQFADSQGYSAPTGAYPRQLINY